jgi:hypothetical protein
MQIAWSDDFEKALSWWERRMLSKSAEYLAELSGVVALARTKPLPLNILKTELSLDCDTNRGGLGDHSGCG